MKYERLSKIMKAIFAFVLSILTATALLIPSNTRAASNIGTKRAKEIAVTHAGFTVKQVSFQKAKLDRDNGVAECEIDFAKSGYRYEYDIDAQSGEIREYSCKKRKFPDAAPIQ